jgi:hypothetical protein
MKKKSEGDVMKKKLSSKAQAYISKAVADEVASGYPLKQAVAIAYSRARKAGYKIPTKRKIKEMS